MSNARDDERAGRTVIGPAGIFITRELRRRVQGPSTRAHPQVREAERGTSPIPGVLVLAEITYGREKPVSR